MFCSQCGKNLPNAGRFCPYCGAPVGTSPAAGPAPTTPPPAPVQPNQPNQPALTPAFQQYLKLLEQRLQQPPRYIPELNAYLFYTSRISAALSKMKQYFYVTQNDQADGNMLKAYSNACTQFTFNSHDGLPRGIVSGLVIYSIMVQTHATPGACAAAAQLPENHYSAFELPVVVDLSTHQLIHCTRTPVWGWAMWSKIRLVADETLLF